MAMDVSSGGGGIMADLREVPSWVWLGGAFGVGLIWFLHRQATTAGQTVTSPGIPTTNTPSAGGTMVGSDGGVSSSTGTGTPTLAPITINVVGTPSTTPASSPPATAAAPSAPVAAAAAPATPQGTVAGYVYGSSGQITGVTGYTAPPGAADTSGVGSANFGAPPPGQLLVPGLGYLPLVGAYNGATVNGLTGSYVQGPNGQLFVPNPTAGGAPSGGGGRASGYGHAMAGTHHAARWQAFHAWAHEGHALYRAYGGGGRAAAPLKQRWLLQGHALVGGGGSSGLHLGMSIPTAIAHAQARLAQQTSADMLVIHARTVGQRPLITQPLVARTVVGGGGHPSGAGGRGPAGHASHASPARGGLHQAAVGQRPGWQ